MAEPVLTRTRKAIWTAIEKWDGLRKNGRSVFPRGGQLKLDDNLTLPEDAKPSFSDLPAIMITSKDVQMEWVSTGTRAGLYWYFILEVRLWTAHFNQETAENLTQQVFLAIHQAKPEGGDVTYVKDATGNHPSPRSSIHFLPVAKLDSDEDETNAILTTMKIATTLKLNLEY